jgi:predicted Fe-S protein YdhL (DUF1289 family)
MNSINGIKSPCIGNCKLDEKKKCTGCKRTENEIALWDNFNDYAKFLIVERINRQSIVNELIKR